MIKLKRQWGIWTLRCALSLLVFVSLIACSMHKEGSAMAPQTGQGMQISSTAFENEAMIPKVYSCDGQNINPPLTFGNVPQNAQSLALIMDDPDAPIGTFVHWVLWNIDPKTTAIAEGTTPAGAQVGSNSKHDTGYTGPCPPGGTHRYYFKLYALDTPLSLPTGADKRKLEKAMIGHIVGQASLMGRYHRSKS